MKNRAKKSRKHTGFIADEVLESLKLLGCQDPHELSSEFGIYTHPREREAVELSEGELGDVLKDTPEVKSFSSLRYTEFIAFLVGSVQELQSRIETLEASIPYEGEKRQKTS